MNIEDVRRCLAGDVHKFYVSGEWRAKRREVLAMDRWECVRCKVRGKYTKANTVHHVRRLKEYPELALEIYYFDGAGKKCRQLVSLCALCHEAEHGNREKVVSFVTSERW